MPNRVNLVAENFINNVLKIASPWPDDPLSNVEFG